MDIAISSGKGGTGKTFASTNLAIVLSESGRDVIYIDCDVEEPNGHLFMDPDIKGSEQFYVYMPDEVDEDACIACGKCVEACQYNALALVRKKLMYFTELCHACGACSLVCPEDAVIEKERPVGEIHNGISRGSIEYHYGELYAGEGGMSPRLIQALKEHSGDDITILDSPPGTACPVVETIKDSDYCVLVADPTPFSIHDLKLSVNMCRAIGKEPGVLINRSGLDQTDLDAYINNEGLAVVGQIPDDRKIAEVYSRGGLAADELPEIRGLFVEIAETILTEAKSGKEPPASAEQDLKEFREEVQKAPGVDENVSGDAKECVILSGKGGTGKTSIAGCFAALAEEPVISDCDVDASDLHLLLSPDIQEQGGFSGGLLCRIDEEACVQCGRCMEECRFSAVNKEDNGLYRINSIACEGCGVCRIVCPAGAVECRDAVNGVWYVSETRFGPMTHAELGFAEENSGRLVTLVRTKASDIAGKEEKKIILIDGSPGTGCPVIASITGAHYALMVTEPTVSGLHDLERVLDVAHHFGIPCGVVVNKADINKEMAGKIRQKTEKTGADYFGEIPYDDTITHAQIECKTLVEYAPDSDLTDTVRSIWNKVAEKVV